MGHVERVSNQKNTASDNIKKELANIDEWFKLKQVITW